MLELGGKYYVTLEDFTQLLKRGQSKKGPPLNHVSESKSSFIDRIVEDYEGVAYVWDSKECRWDYISLLDLLGLAYTKTHEVFYWSIFDCGKGGIIAAYEDYGANRFKRFDSKRHFFQEVLGPFYATVIGDKYE